MKDKCDMIIDCKMTYVDELDCGMVDKTDSIYIVSKLLIRKCWNNINLNLMSLNKFVHLLTKIKDMTILSIETSETCIWIS